MKKNVSRVFVVQTVSRVFVVQTVSRVFVVQTVVGRSVVPVLVIWWLLVGSLLCWQDERSQSFSTYFLRGLHCCRRL